MKLGTWLLALLEPAVGRILAALGFSVVQITGLTVAINTIRDKVIQDVSALPADLLNVFLLSGGGVAFGIITGAITTKLLMWQITSSTRILGVNPG